MKRVFFLTTIVPCLFVGTLLSFKQVPHDKKPACQECVWYGTPLNSPEAADEEKQKFKEAHKESILVSATELEEWQHAGFPTTWNYKVTYQTAGSCYKNGAAGL